VTATREAILEAELPIVDPHHHLWDRPTEILKDLPPSDHGFMDIIKRVPRYLLDELLADLRSGHDVRATVYLECGAMYRADGPEVLRAVGEIEFVNGVAAMTASGLYGPVRACAGIAISTVALPVNFSPDFGDHCAPIVTSARPRPPPDIDLRKLSAPPRSSTQVR